MESIHIFGGIFAVAFIIFLIISSVGLDEMDGGGDMDFADGSGSLEGEIFNLRSFLILLIGFGAAGGVTRYFGVSTEISALAGVVFGGILVAFAVMLYRVLNNQQGNTKISLAESIGKTAHVVVRIDEHVVGQVHISINGVMTSAMARAKTGSIGAGESVTVVEVNGSELIVEKTAQ